MTVAKRPLGNSTIEISEIGLGAWQFADEGWGGPDENESARIVDEALALGVTFIDTAPGYAGGKSEAALGRALEGRRDQVVLCTKFGYWADEPADYSAGRIEESLTKSLTRLRTDYVDVLLIHSPPFELMDGTTAPHYRELERLKDAGMIRAYGVSGRDDTSEEIRRIVETTGSQAIEIRFNALYQEPAEAFAAADEAGVGLIVKVPLESGWLSGKYNADSRFEEGPRSRWTPEQIAERAALVDEFAALLPAGVSTTHGALRHILAQPQVSTVIPGTKSIEQLRENVAATDAGLLPDTLAAIRKLGEGRSSLAW